MYKNTGAWVNFVVIFNLPRCRSWTNAIQSRFLFLLPASRYKLQVRLQPLLLIPLGTGTWLPTVCDGNFRGVLHPRVFFSVHTSHGSNRAGRPLFKTLSKPADATEYPDEKAASASCEQFKFPVDWCVPVYVRLS